MKKILLITLVLAVFFVMTGVASASPHWRGGFGFGLNVAPPPAYYYPGPGYYYPPPAYHYPGYTNRTWIPGYWERRWGPYGWERVWVPGHWQYYGY